MCLFSVCSIDLLNKYYSLIRLFSIGRFGIMFYLYSFKLKDYFYEIEQLFAIDDIEAFFYWNDDVYLRRIINSYTGLPAIAVLLMDYSKTWPTSLFAPKPKLDAFLESRLWLSCEFLSLSITNCSVWGLFNSMPRMAPLFRLPTSSIYSNCFSLFW